MTSRGVDHDREVRFAPSLKIYDPANDAHNQGEDVHVKGGGIGIVHGLHNQSEFRQRLDRDGIRAVGFHELIKDAEQGGRRRQRACKQGKFDEAGETSTNAFTDVDVPYFGGTFSRNTGNVLVLLAQVHAYNDLQSAGERQERRGR